MAVDERSRHELYLRLESVVGRQEADTLMSLLPVGWADVATKHDLERDLAALESRVVATIRTETRTLLLAMLSFGATVASLTYAAVRLG